MSRAAERLAAYRESRLLVTAVVCLAIAGAAFAQAPEPSLPLPAEQIIFLLQGHPDLVAPAKATAVAALRERGLAITEMTDDGLYSEIRSDYPLRVLVSKVMRALGYPKKASTETIPPPTVHEIGLLPKYVADEPPISTPHEIGLIARRPADAPPVAAVDAQSRRFKADPPPATRTAPTSSPQTTKEFPKENEQSAKYGSVRQDSPSVATASAAGYLRNFARDQEAIWTSPTRIRGRDLKWLVPAAGVTAGLFSADAELAQRVRNLPLAGHGNSFSNAGVAALLGGTGGLFLLGKIQGDDHKRETGILAGEAAANALVLDSALKFTTQRERPTDGAGQGRFFTGSGLNSSFASAHAALAWSSASVLAHEYPGPLTKIFGYGAAAAVSYSRVAASKHFPSDVVVGSLMGYLIGEHVYASHHDPQLPGGDYGTFTRSVLPESGSTTSIASPYVPLDNWIYPAFERLSGLGFVHSGLLGLRPWTRRECARLLEEASPMVDETSNEEASRLYVVLAREFAPEMAGSADRYAQLDSVYARVTSISGPPLTDGYHFGQTLVNDYGRPYQRGLNSVAGFSGSAAIGALGFYVRGEYEHAGSGPGYSQAVQDAIQTTDHKPLVAATPVVPAFNHARLLDSYVMLNIKGWQASFGKQSLWLGPTQDPFLASDNAEPVYMFRVAQTTPSRLPSIFGILGPFRTEAWFGRLAGHRFVNAPTGAFISTGAPLDRQPFIDGVKVNFKPTPNLEFGVGRTGLFGGPEFPVTLHTFGRSMFSTGNAPGVLDPGDRRSSFDFSYHIPGLRKWLVLYNDSFVEDEVSPIGYPRRAAQNQGLYMPQLPGLPKLDLRVEGGYTNLPNLKELSGPGFFYWNIRYSDGYTNDGFILGNGTVGRQGIAFRAASTYWFASNKTIQIGYRSMDADTGFLGGGNLKDVSLRSEWSFSKGVSLSSLLQYEAWNFRLLSAGVPQNNFTASFQLTYWPRWKLGHPQ